MTSKKKLKEKIIDLELELDNIKSENTGHVGSIFSLEKKIRIAEYELEKYKSEDALFKYNGEDKSLEISNEMLKKIKLIKLIQKVTSVQTFIDYEYGGIIGHPCFSKSTVEEKYVKIITDTLQELGSFLFNAFKTDNNKDQDEHQ